jgi:23S rRNA (pseudouridine1915-N3)-methyltransferase
MRIRVVAVGRVKERPMRAAIDEYVARIAHYAPFEEIELDDLPGAKLEAAVLKAAKGARLVPLDACGKQHTSRAFASLIERHGAQGKGEMAFVIGGREGLPRALLDAHGPILSLSEMTLPHRLARLVLVEQIYRGLTLLRGEPYGM